MASLQCVSHLHDAIVRTNQWKWCGLYDDYRDLYGVNAKDVVSVIQTVRSFDEALVHYIKSTTSADRR